MIPIELDWRAIVMRFRERGMSDDQVSNMLSLQGVVVHRSTIAYIRSGKLKCPRYQLGAALLNAVEMTKNRPASRHYRVNCGRRANWATHGL